MDLVISADGTPIAVERTGRGPAVILVGGAFNDRTTVRALADALAPHFTVYIYDRRGRGASGDQPQYAVEREMDDLSAVIAHAGGSAFVFGHSSGGVLGLEAAARGLPITKLVVYEPSYLVDVDRPLPPADLADRLAQFVAQDRRGEAVALFLTEAASVPPNFVEAMRADPSWAWMEGLAHTLPYDVSLHGPRQSMPDRLTQIAVPTLVVDGGASPKHVRTAARAVAQAVPDATHVTLEGQDHAVLHHPEALAPMLFEFLVGRPQPNESIVRRKA